MSSTARPVLGSIIAAVTLVVVIVACGTSATPAPPTVTPAGGGAGASSGAAATDDGLGGLGGLFGSLDLGSFGNLGNLLHGAPDLEAILPSQACGAATIKFSFGGASFGSAAGQIPAIYGQILGTTGKTMADVSFASAASTADNCPSFSAFKVNGMDQSALQGFYTTMATNDGDSPTSVSLGGKAVVKTSGDTYAYFKGDTVFVINADSDDVAAAGLQLLP